MSEIMPIAANPDHVNVVVSDIGRSEAFYAAVLGMKKTFETVLTGAWIDEVTGQSGVEARCVFMESPGSSVRIELLEFVRPTACRLSENSAPHVPGVRHIAFLVADLDDFYARALCLGAPFVSGPVTVPFPLPGGRRKRLCYFHDPDGTLLEAAEYTTLPVSDD